ncbi:MAG: PSD1 and planctomycete cytochrome C domain-containing protein [Verrucomicrobiota bacterium]
MWSRFRPLAFCLILSLPGWSLAASPEDLAFFEKSIRPILDQNCYSCHGTRKQSVGLRMDSRAAILRGSDYRKVIKPGDPAGSILIQAMKHIGKGIKPMPEDEPPLSDQVIADFEKWVRLDLPWPEEETPSSPDKKAQLAESHWAFKPIQVPEIPENLEQHPIDFLLDQKRATFVIEPEEPLKQSAFARFLDRVLGKEAVQETLQTSPVADSTTIVKRLHFGLTGLPPTADEITRFAENPDVLAKIDELLQRSQYGEHWARHWLDVARYADTMGYIAGGKDNRYPYSYTYRDWVTQALNQDLPYHEFVRLQIAADVNRPANHPDLAALGFLTLGRNASILDVTDDQIDVVTRGLLGLTVSCARCHDHKFDPIPTRDYYALHGVFRNSTKPTELPVIGYPDDKEAVADYNKTKAQIEADALAFKREIYTVIHSAENVAGHLKFAMKFRDSPDPVFDREIQGAGYRKNLGRKWRDFLRRSRKNPNMAPFEALWAAPPAAYSQILANASGNMAPPAKLAWNWHLDHPSKNRDELANAQARFLLHYFKQPGSAPAANQLQSLANASPLGIPVENTHTIFTQIDRGKLEKINKKLVKLDIESPGAPIRAMAVQEVEKPRDYPILIRGQGSRRGDIAERAFLKILGNDPLQEGSGRKQLAESIVDPDNPLTARVFVNRVWGWHFGQPLVDTPSDFGVQTEMPLHHELLDYLANWFLNEGGQSLKNLHRHLLTTEAFQLSSSPASDHDPENLYFTRVNRKRLSFEKMRDSILLASNSLELEVGGRPVKWNDPGADERRSIYGFIDRYRLDPMLATFDFPNPDLHSPQRYETSVPQQTLFLLNSPFVLRHAEKLETQANAVAQPDLAGVETPARSLKDRIDFVYQQVLKRPPSGEEQTLALEFLQSGVVEPDNPKPGDWEYRIGPASLDESGNLVFSESKPFPYFSEKGKAWRFGEEYPHPVGRFANLHPQGGHTPATDQAVLLRLNATRKGDFTLTGKLSVPGPSSDGVLLFIRKNEAETIAKLHVSAHGILPISVPSLSLQPGDKLDFLVHANGSTNSDSFRWALSLREVSPQKSGPTRFAARARNDFNYVRDILAGTNGPGSWTYWMANLEIPETGGATLANLAPIRQLDEESLKLTPLRQFPVPNRDLGYLSLYPTGGHPGQDSKVVIRRWRANATGKYRVSGEVFRPSQKGDGIRAMILKNGTEILKDITLTDPQKHATPLPLMELKAGTTLEFLVSANGTADHDGFQWTKKIERVNDEGKVNYTSVSDREFELFAKIKRGELVPGRWSYLHAKVANLKSQNLALKQVATLPQRDSTGALRLKLTPNSDQPEAIHLHLSGEGGHPGLADHVAVRRWTADRQGTVSISGDYRMLREGGDGVSFVVRHSRHGIILRDRVAGGAVSPKSVSLDFVDVREGDTIDFLVLPEETPNFDRYAWSPTIVWESAAKPSGQLIADYARDFLGQHGVPISHQPDQYPLAALAQTLMISNEFMFID